jgi:hypothetical protein
MWLILQGLDNYFCFCIIGISAYTTCTGTIFLKGQLPLTPLLGH